MDKNNLLHFYKYHGAGNDFILVDNRKTAFNHQNPPVLASLCDRRFGIGGDGIMFIQDKEGYDFEMIYYNSDGNPSSMCGNGGRCIVAFARYLNMIKEETNFLAVDGPHYAKISENGDWVSLQMIDVSQIYKDDEAFILNTGSPHYVKEVAGLSELDVYQAGKEIRDSTPYKEHGINVNFVEEKDGRLFVRTYERGVENETYACGTGVTAVAIAMAQKKGLFGEISTPIEVRGGHLNVKFHRQGNLFTRVFLEGPAKFVFEGDILI